MRDEALLETRNLTKTFGGEHAVDNVSVKIPQGKVTALVGDNGAGKSTFCKLISGAHIENSGEIYFKGQQVRIDTPDKAKELGIEMLYQDGALIEDIDVPGNIFAGREILKNNLGIFSVLDKQKMKTEAKKLLDRFNIVLKSLDDPVRNLSGGQRQCTAISRTLIVTPELLILDEPLAALGAKEGRNVHRLIEELKENLTILIISHNLEHVFNLCDYVIVLRAGKLVGAKYTDETSKNEIMNLIVGESEQDGEEQ